MSVTAAEVHDTPFGPAEHLPGNRWRFPQQMNTETFGTVVVTADTVDAAVRAMTRLHRDGAACWKR